MWIVNFNMVGDSVEKHTLFCICQGISCSCSQRNTLVSVLWFWCWVHQTDDRQRLPRTIILSPSEWAAGRGSLELLNLTIIKIVCTQGHKASKGQRRLFRSPLARSHPIALCVVKIAALHSACSLCCPTQTNFGAILPVNALGLGFSQLHLEILNQETFQCTDHLALLPF